MKPEMKKERRIVYEDFDANYVDTMDDSVDSIIDDEDDERPDLPAGLIPIDPEMILGKIVTTPWGNFTKKNKFAPFNFYSLQIMHMAGMSTLSIPRFAEVMDSIEGIALWRSLDPYTIIIGKAKLYDWADVKANIADAFLTEKPSPVELTTKKIIDDNVNKQYFAVIFPNGKSVVTLEGDESYEKNVAEAQKLKDALRGVVLIKNGVVQ